MITTIENVIPDDAQYLYCARYYKIGKHNKVFVWAYGEWVTCPGISISELSKASSFDKLAEHNKRKGICRRIR
jgi:hypothetical protein